MKIDTDYYNHFPNTKIEADREKVWLTDETGAVWEVYAMEGGLRVRSISTPRESISVRPEASNTITLHARTWDETPEPWGKADIDATS